MEIGSIGLQATDFSKGRESAFIAMGQAVQTRGFLTTDPQMPRRKINA